MADQRPDHDRWIAWTLKIGMWLSACLLLGGLILTPLTPAKESSGLFLNMPEFLGAAVQGQLPLSETLLYAGIMTLIFTPVMRVGIAVVTFVAERDGKFVGVSVAVLVVLLLEVIISLS
ncbi:MAG: DUF1634 domain-containing protein [Bacteroidota bacterium]